MMRAWLMIVMGAILILMGAVVGSKTGKPVVEQLHFSQAAPNQGMWIPFTPPPDSTFVACWKQSLGPENTIVVCQ